MNTQEIKKSTLAEKQAFWTEQLPLFKEAYWLPEHFELLKFDMEAGNFIVCDDLDPTFEDDADDLYHRINTGWSMWKRAVNHMQEKLEGCVVVQLENVRYFSNDGENYEIHETIEDAKREAECAIEYYSERLADQQLDPRSDGNFQQISYGVVLAESSYSIDHIVTQQDKDNGDYSYEVSTEIMSLFLAEAARGGNNV